MPARLAITMALALIAGSGAALAQEGRLLFDGSGPSGWVIYDKAKDQTVPLPAANVQADGLNPHKSGGYIVVHETPAKDFVLDFDYKLSKGCNSGVFVRVGDLKDPVMTGLEIALDDSTGTGLHDSGAIYDLVAPTANVQKPAGEWNHMTITARGPVVRVAINGREVSRIDQSEWPRAGLRPDGSKHKFAAVAIKDLARKGHFGFQDHGQDCWYKNVRVMLMD